MFWDRNWARLRGRLWVKAVSQGSPTIGDIGVAGDPAAVGGAPVDVALPVVEHVLEGRAGADHVPGRGVLHALGLARGAAGVQLYTHAAALESAPLENSLQPGGEALRTEPHHAALLLEPGQSQGLIASNQPIIYLLTGR